MTIKLHTATQKPASGREEDRVYLSKKRFVIRTGEHNTEWGLNSIIIFFKGNTDKEQCVDGAGESDTDESISLYRHIRFLVQRDLNEARLESKKKLQKYEKK